MHLAIIKVFYFQLMHKFKEHLFTNINQLDALNFIISLFQASKCFEHMCSSSGGQKLYYTVSGIITPIGVFNGVRLVCLWVIVNVFVV